MSYYISFNDPEKTPLEVEDSTTNTETSLTFSGYNELSYGFNIANNFLNLLENFANDTEPEKPIQGQIWYNTDEEVDQVFVYDGIQWRPVSGVHKSIEQPTNPNIGDIWVDQNSRKGYIYINDNWIFFSSDESSNNKNGVSVDVITCKDLLDHTVIKVNIGFSIVAIISKEDFEPKIFIPGFSKIKAGINLNSQKFSGSSLFQFSGISEKSKSLLIDGEEVLSGNFMRSDKAGYTSHGITVESNDGIMIGDLTKLSVGIEDDLVVLKNQRSGSKIKFQITESNNVSDVLTIINNKIGINNVDPEYELDVSGRTRISDSVFIDDNTNSLTTNDGALIVRGGVGVQKNLNIRGYTVLHNNTQVSSMTPLSSNSYIGDEDNKFNKIHANDIYGTFHGILTGNIQGRASSASILDNTTTFSITGDIRSTSDVSFRGDGDDKVFHTSLDDYFIYNKENKNNTNYNDYLLFHDTNGANKLKRITISNFVKSVPSIPVGTVIPFAGKVPPIGWLLCNGRELRSREYQLLYDVIGHTYTPEDQARLGRFMLPNLIGKMPLGSDGMTNDNPTNSSDIYIGETGGNSTINLEPDNIPEHSHSLSTETKDFYTVTEVGQDGEPYIEVGLPWDDGGFPQRKRLFVNDQVGNSMVSNTEAINILNPHVKMNYIIFTGRNI